MATVEEEIESEEVTFKSLVRHIKKFISVLSNVSNEPEQFLRFFKGVVDVLCEACQQLGWKSPTKIQREAIPVALQGEK